MNQIRGNKIRLYQRRFRSDTMKSFCWEQVPVFWHTQGGDATARTELFKNKAEDELSGGAWIVLFCRDMELLRLLPGSFFDFMVILELFYLVWCFLTRKLKQHVSGTLMIHQGKPKTSEAHAFSTHLMSPDKKNTVQEQIFLVYYIWWLETLKLVLCAHAMETNAPLFPKTQRNALEQMFWVRIKLVKSRKLRVKLRTLSHNWKLLCLVLDA